MELNKIYNEDCIEFMNKVSDDYVDLTITSPPYDNLRDYNGYLFDFNGTAKELYRVTKEGGIVVRIVNDATINGSETLTSFKQAIKFKEIGFNVHDTMIWQKVNFSNPSSNRYHQIFEYMFILSKGKPKTFNPIKDRKNIYAGRGTFGINTSRLKSGEMKTTKRNIISDYGMRYNVRRGNTSGQENMCKKIEHPATFPLRLVSDHIKTWSNEGDIVLDCFMGSGTTAVACKELNRNYIGCEISKQYCDIAEKRLLDSKIE